MTPRQLQALQYAVEKGGAAYVPGRRMGGATRRMIVRMAADGLLEQSAPFPATERGITEFRAIVATKGN